MAGKIREEIVRCFNTHITSELQPKSGGKGTAKKGFQYPYNERVATEIFIAAIALSEEFQYPYNERVATIPTLNGTTVIDVFQYPYNERVATLIYNCIKYCMQFQYPYNERVAT